MPAMPPHKARQVLGVGPAATAEEIRRAWKRRVKLFHPDRPGGDAARFLAANTAYETLVTPMRQGTFAEATPKWAGAKPRPKPKAPAEEAPAAEDPLDRRGQGGAAAAGPKTRVMRVSLGMQTAYRALLAREVKRWDWAEAVRRNGGFYVDPARPRPAAPRGQAHVAESIRVEDGRVLVEIPTPMVWGENLVALPAGTRAGDRPAVITVSSRDAGAGRVRLPKDRREATFPWAKDVSLVFKSGSRA